MGSGPVLALLLMTLVHLVGMVLLIALMGRDILDVFRATPRRDDDGPEPPSADPAVPPAGGGGGLPLPDAEHAPVRLREPGRIADRYGRRPRRPEHEPAREPERV
jgi:hypothetical protein